MQLLCSLSKNNAFFLRQNMTLQWTIERRRACCARKKKERVSRLDSFSKDIYFYLGKQSHIERHNKGIFTRQLNEDKRER